MKRTLSQNASLHRYSTELARALNDAGFDQKEVMDKFKDSFHIPWSMEALKNIFREVGRVMYDVESTKDLTTVQIQAVYRVVDMRISEITGVRCEWPSMESIMIEEQNNEKKNYTNNSNRYE